MLRDWNPTRAQTDPQIKEVSRFALGALRASSFIFYWIDETLAMSVEDMVGPCQRNFDLYQRDMERYDPLNVRRLVMSRKKVATLSRDSGLAPPPDFDRYRGYMRDSDIADVLDFIFWLDDVPIAGLGIMKTPGDPPFCANSLSFAFSMQPYIEFNLTTSPRVRRQRVTRRLTTDCALTRREIEVTELICVGLTNQDIGEAMSIGVGTVKTHVLRIFQKVGIENRAALVAWVGQIGVDCTLDARRSVGSLAQPNSSSK